MSSQDEQQSQKQAYRELKLVSEIESNPDVTQRELSHRLGIALGLTNVLLRNLAQKGYVRVAGATWKRRLYNLTPEGLNHKIRLTISYIHRTLDHYQSVRQTLRQQLEPFMLNEESRVAIFGTGEFAELVYLGLRELGLSEIDVFADSSSISGQFLGMPIHSIDSIETRNYDRILFAVLNREPSEHLVEALDNDGGPEKLVTFFLESQLSGHVR